MGQVSYYLTKDHVAIVVNQDYDYNIGIGNWCYAGAGYVEH